MGTQELVFRFQGTSCLPLCNKWTHFPSARKDAWVLVQDRVHLLGLKMVGRFQVKCVVYCMV